MFNIDKHYPDKFYTKNNLSEFIEEYNEMKIKKGFQISVENKAELNKIIKLYKEYIQKLLSI